MVECKDIPATILIVDDDPMIRNLLKQALTKCGFVVKVAKDGEEALDVAIDPDIKLIIMDGSMPRLDGFEASKSIKEDINPYVKIILLTAAFSRTPIQYRKKGSPIIDSFMRKPFDISQLREEIYRLLETE